MGERGWGGEGGQGITDASKGPPNVAFICGVC